MVWLCCFSHVCHPTLVCSIPSSTGAMDSNVPTDSTCADSLVAPSVPLSSSFPPLIFVSYA